METKEDENGGHFGIRCIVFLHFFIAEKWFVGEDKTLCKVIKIYLERIQSHLKIFQLEDGCEFTPETFPVNRIIKTFPPKFLKPDCATLSCG